MNRNEKEKARIKKQTQRNRMIDVEKIHERNDNTQRRAVARSLITNEEKNNLQNIDTKRHRNAYSLNQATSTCIESSNCDENSIDCYLPCTSVTNKRKKYDTSNNNNSKTYKRNIFVSASNDIVNENAIEDNLESNADSMSKLFDQKLDKWKIYHCVICFKGVQYDKKPNNIETFKCQSCRHFKTNEDNYFSFQENNPGSIPDELKEYKLTFIEEQLIALVCVNQYVYIRGKGAVVTNGHCINFAQEITEVARILPRLPKELPLVFLRKENDNGQIIDFKVRREYVYKWLKWLKSHSPILGYKNLQIDEDRINNLPIDGYLDNLKVIETDTDVDIDTNLGPNHNDSNNEINKLTSSMSCQSIDEKIDLNPENSLENFTCTNTGVPIPPQSINDDATVLNNTLNNIINETTTIKYPEKSKEPLSEYTTPYLASMAFPTLFPYGKGDPFGVDNHRNKENLLNKVKHLLYYCELINGHFEYRFAQHARFVLWLYNIVYRHRTLSQGNIYLKQNPKDANMTIEELKKLVDLHGTNPVISNMQRYMANITGSASYWKNVSNDLDSIIATKGPPHAFFTFSFADGHDPYLHKFIGVPENASDKVVHEYLKKYPHLTNWWFTQKFKHFREVWLEESLKGHIKYGGWIWYRFEWQHRGAIHVHGLIKMGGDAPDLYDLNEKAIAGHVLSNNITDVNHVLTDEEIHIIEIGKESEIKLIKFHDKYVNCDVPIQYHDYIPPKYSIPVRPTPMKRKYIEITPEEKDQDLLDLTILLERHNCKIGHCQKVSNGQIQSCRFKFPKILSDKTKIEYTRTMVKGQPNGPWQLNIIPKRVNDARINNHNLFQLQNFRANVDFSITHDFSKVKAYITKYASKCETRSNAFKNAFDNIFFNAKPDETDTKQVLKRVMTKVLGQRDISFHEALHSLMSLKLHDSNITVIKTSLDRSKEIIENDDTGELQIKDCLMDLYSNRDKYSNDFADIVNLNFIKFCTRFTTNGNKLKERVDTQHYAVRIIQKFSSNPKSSQYNLHCKFQLLRYKKWLHNINTALDGEPDTSLGWVTAWQSFLITDEGKCQVPSWSTVIHNAEIYLNEIDNNQIENLYYNGDDHEDDTIEQDDWMRNQHDKTINYNDDVADVSVENIEYWSRDRQYYSNEVLNTIGNWLENTKSTYFNKNDLPSKSQINLETLNTEQKRIIKIIKLREDLNDEKNHLLLRVEGTAGTGKSYLINSFSNIVPNETFVVAAFTGKAANNVNGQTLHSLLHINAQNKNITLKGMQKTNIQKKFEHIKYLIIDEYSMIGCKLLAIIDERLRSAKCRPQIPFGGINILLIGDSKQLPPVCDTVLWDKNTTNDNCQVKHGLALFQLFDTVIKLTQIIRQGSASQARFRELLLRLRVGELNENDYELLKTRIYGIAENSPLFENALYVMPFNIQVDDFNTEMLQKLAINGEKTCRINGQHNCAEAQNASKDDMMGLLPTIHIARGAKVMITSNLWTEMGLTNGACGYVKHIIFEVNCSPPSLPLAVVVEMDENYKGPHLPDKPRCVALNPKTAFMISKNNTHLERTQIPLRVAFAITIHKCQGMTLDKLRICLGAKEKPVGLTFVALSRVRCLEDLTIDYHDFDIDRLMSIRLTNSMHQFDIDTELAVEFTKIKYENV